VPPLLPDVLLFALGVALLLGGGEALVRGAVALAARLGVPAFVIGLSVVAFGTSAPELALNVAAAVRGNSALSFGNIVGSNIANIGLILGFTALLRPMRVHSSIVRRELPLMLLVTAVFIGMFIIRPGGEDSVRTLTRFEGAGLLVGFAMFCTLLVVSARRPDGDAAELIQEGAATAEKAAHMPLARAIGLTLLGLAGLVGGGRLAESGAVGVAEKLGMSSELIGLTIVAVATSLPELAASTMAALRGHSDLAVGNIVGSNLFNILLVMGVTACISPVDLPAEGALSLGALALLSVLLIPISRTMNQTVSRVEGSVLLLLYAGYIGLEVWRAVAG
jgi:cation:H+ antiporter